VDDDVLPRGRVVRSEDDTVGSSTSIDSTHHCFDPGLEQLTYSRQPPPGSGTSAGRSREADPNGSLVTTETVSNVTPSSERATTFA
jgi:hypothetical protein